MVGKQILMVGLFIFLFPSARAQNPPPPTTCPPPPQTPTNQQQSNTSSNAALLALIASLQNNSTNQQANCGQWWQNSHKSDAKIQKLCNQLGQSTDHPKDGTNSSTCENDISVCTQTFKKEMSDSSDAVNKDGTDPEDDLTDNPAPKVPPQPGSPKYCPDFSSEPTYTGSSAFNTACMNLKVQGKVDALKAYLDSDASSLDKKETSFETAETKLLDSQKQCQEQDSAIASLTSFAPRVF